MQYSIVTTRSAQLSLVLPDKFMLARPRLTAEILSDYKEAVQNVEAGSYDSIDMPVLLIVCGTFDKNCDCIPSENVVDVFVRESDGSFSRCPYLKQGMFTFGSKYI